MADQIKRIRYEFFLIIDEFGGIRTTKREGALKAGERSIGMQVIVPLAIFRTPMLRATVTVPDTGAPDELTAAVLASAETEIRAATGLEIVLTAIKQEEGA